jgi:hypothetical protein
MSKGLEAVRALLSKKGVERIAEIFPPSIKNIRPVQGKVRAATLLEKAAGIKGARTQSKLLSSCCDASPFLSEKVQAAPGLLDTPGAIALLYILHLKVCSESLRNSCLAIAHKLGAANVRGLYEEVIDYLDDEEVELLPSAEQVQREHEARLRTSQEHSAESERLTKEVAAVRAALQLQKDLGLPTPEHLQDLARQAVRAVTAHVRETQSSGFHDAERLLHMLGHSHSEAAGMCTVFGKFLAEACRAAGFQPQTVKRRYGAGVVDVAVYNPFDPKQGRIIRAAYDSYRNSASYCSNADESLERERRGYSQHMCIANIVNARAPRQDHRPWQALVQGRA